MDEDQFRRAMRSSENVIFFSWSGGGSTRSDSQEITKFYENRAEGKFAQSGLEAVADNLEETVLELRRHSSVPAEFFLHGRNYQLAADHFGQILGTEGEERDKFVEQCGGRNVDVHSCLVQWMKGEIECPHKAPAPSLLDLPSFGFVHGEESDKIMTALGRSLIIEAWTMFESLSEDLWEAAINSHPHTLGSLNGKMKVTFDDLQANRFDVAKRLGTILRHQKSTVSFRTLWDIRESYSAAFSKHDATILAPLNDPGLQCAAAVRNLLIHKRGIVDKEFCGQVAHDPYYSQFKEGKVPVIQSCMHLVDTCRVCACWLVNAVHSWIINHP